MKQKLEELCAPFIEDLGYELVDLTYGKEGAQWILRIYIDHPKGIGITDCEKVSKSLSNFLDAEDPIPYSYILEVSSPGLDRPLKKEKDFVRFQGNIILVKTKEAVGSRKKIKGKLMGINSGQIEVLTESEKIFISLDNILSARLVPQFDNDF
ncbi:MAG: Ribosome maturation factor RimP [Clostridia bacterium 41_269]|nr:MAG: Ribosome maturation factor RimP [Clostridia bacterium 41_269]